jgi:uncharacterized membrane protein
VPILAIIAIVRVRQLESRGAGGLGDQLKISRLEQRIAGIEKALAQLIKQVGTSAPVVASPPAIPASAPSPPLSATPKPLSQSLPPSAPLPLSPQAAAVPRPPLTVPGAARPHIPSRAPEHFAADSELDLESRVAGKWLNYVGIVALLFATAFFIKYAFDNNWVGARGRVAIGLIAGALVLAWSDWLLHRGYKYFSEGIAGLGAAILYLSLWGGWHYYRIFNSGQAFAGMIVVTAVMCVIALGRNSQRLALLALVGGFLTPELVSTGQDHEIVLFTYTAILSMGMLALERARTWKWLPPIAFAATELYYWGWYGEFYAAEKLARTLAFATLFFIIFAALPMVRSRREGRIGDSEYFIAIGNVLVFLLALQQMLWPDYRWSLTASYLALAALHLVAVRALPEPKLGPRNEIDHVRWLFAGLALLCISLAIPARLDHHWLTMAWAIEGVLLVWSGVRMDSWKLRGAGMLLMAIAAVRILILSIPAGRFLLNERFLTYVVLVACFALSCWFAQPMKDALSHGEKNLFAALAVAINVYALIALSLEIWDFFWRTQALGLERWLAQQLGLSLFWTIYAATLIALGLARRSAPLRWQALALFGIVVAKVFFYDMSSLDRIYRILSFLVLGILLLGVSFAYQKLSKSSDLEKMS